MSAKQSSSRISRVRAGASAVECCGNCLSARAGGFRWRRQRHAQSTPAIHDRRRADHPSTSRSRATHAGCSTRTGSKRAGQRAPVFAGQRTTRRHRCRACSSLNGDCLPNSPTVVDSGYYPSYGYSGYYYPPVAFSFGFGGGYHHGGHYHGGRYHGGGGPHH